MLLKVPKKLGDEDILSVWEGAVLAKKAAAADGDSHVEEKRERLSGGCCFIELLRYEGSVLVGDKGAVILYHKCTRALLAKPAVVDLTVISCPADCAAMEAIDEIGGSTSLPWTAGEGIERQSRGEIFSYTGTEPKSLTSLRNHGAQFFDMVRIDESDSLSGINSAANVRSALSVLKVRDLEAL